jgi:general stress protein YciG
MNRTEAAKLLGSLGGKRTRSILSPEERAESARKAGKALMASLSPEERSARARKAARKGKRVITPEQRAEWGRKGGLAKAKKRLEQK